MTRSSFVPRVDLAERSKAEPGFWIICSRRNARAWRRVMTKPGQRHLGERISRVVARTIEGKMWHGSPSISWCRRCGRRCITSRIYQARQYRIDWGTVLGTDLVRRRMHATRCRPCKAETAARRRERSNAARTARRADARAGRHCETCGAVLESRRRTQRFCSVTCRVTHWRNANGSPPPGSTSSVAVTGELP
jgi:hypothetical protein